MNKVASPSRGFPVRRVSHCAPPSVRWVAGDGLARPRSRCLYLACNSLKRHCCTKLEAEQGPEVRAALDSWRSTVAIGTALTDLEIGVAW